MTIIDPREIGARLRELRGDRTLQEVADSVGTTRQAVAGYEDGSYTPQDDVKIRLAAYYGVPVEQIFFKPESS